MTSLFAVKSQPSSDITKAEVLFANFVADNNLSSSLPGQFADLVIFTDRNIAKLERRRTKRQLSNGSFSIMIDLVRCIMNIPASTKSGILDMSICNDGINENKFTVLGDSLKGIEIQLQNVVGYLSHNFNVMIGSRNSVLTRVKG